MKFAKIIAKLVADKTGILLHIYGDGGRLQWIILRRIPYQPDYRTGSDSVSILGATLPEDADCDQDEYKDPAYNVFFNLSCTNTGLPFRFRASVK